MSVNVPLHRCLRVRKLPTAIAPYEALPCFADQPFVCLLENPGRPSSQARYSFLCANPFWIFQAQGATCRAGPPGDLRPLPGESSEELKALLARHRGEAPREAVGLPPFLGGAVGYLGYELLHGLESIPSPG